MPFFKKKPVVVEAKQFHINGEGLQELLTFIGVPNDADTYAFVLDEIQKNNGLIIHTLEGAMLASDGDYIIRGVSNEFYPCKPDIFHKTYDQEVMLSIIMDTDPDTIMANNKPIRELQDALREKISKGESFDEVIKATDLIEYGYLGNNHIDITDFDYLGKELAKHFTDEINKDRND